MEVSAEELAAAAAEELAAAAAENGVDINFPHEETEVIGQKDPTCTEEGYTAKLPQPDPDNSKTGDSFMAHLWIMGMLGSVAALAALVIFRKRSFQA